MSDHDDKNADETAMEEHGTEDEEKKISKRQLKRQIKKEKKLEFRMENRRKERLRKKKKLCDMRERGEVLPPSRKSLKRRKMADSTCRIPIVFDCSFDELMSVKDINDLIKQIQHSYSSNRRAPNPVQFYVTSLGGNLLQRLDEIGDWGGWDINMERRDIFQVFGKEKIVYLTSDSPNVLDTLDENKAYVIGGLVDHNHHKGLCYQQAVERGIAHAQLPLKDYIQLQTRKILTSVHVFQILLRFTETDSWEKAFFDILPKRKGLTSKNDTTNEENSELSQNSDNDKETVESEHCESNEVGEYSDNKYINKSALTKECKEAENISCDTTSVDKVTSVNSDVVNEKCDTVTDCKDNSGKIL